MHTVCVTGYHTVSYKYTQLLIQLKMLEGLEEELRELGGHILLVDEIDAHTRPRPHEFVHPVRFQVTFLLKSEISFGQGRSLRTELIGGELV